MTFGYIIERVCRQGVLLLTVALSSLLVCCSSKSADNGANAGEEEESREAKAMLQGIWVDEETDEVSFRAEGDTIYYPDSVSQPTCFRIVGDSLVLRMLMPAMPLCASRLTSSGSATRLATKSTLTRAKTP